ncbi:MAG TPA: hypothetical protein VK662_16700 [Acidothermaceae bacterium]|nr:hypothetical protein [Acidothermaceae bacterium]
MTTLKVTETTTATPAQFLEALTDFGPHRSEIWSNSQPEFLVVHDRGDTWADVTEGSKAAGAVWERLRYDWSNPTDIVLTTTDSNTWGGKSGHRYTLTQAGGATSVHAVIVRDGISTKGRIIAAMLVVLGPTFIKKSLRSTLRAIEARNATA